ncbi:MAG: glycosyltransferase [Clostridia bacterium]|nr:glycosyltransferase [Clostridia bacterium]
MNKKKYLFVIRSMTGGGAERVVSVLASRMARKGSDISIIAYDRTENDYPVDPAVKMYYMPEAKRNLIGKASRITAMRRLIRQIQPDVIIPFVGTILFVAYLASLPEKIPFIRTVRNSPWKEENNFFKKMALRFIEKKASAIWVQNKEQTEFFPEKFHKKIYVIPNPVSDSFIDSGKEHYCNRIKRIVTAGRLSPQKNQALLIRGFAEAAKRDADIELMIYGTGGEKEYLQQLIDGFKLSDRCVLCGRNNDMVSVLKETDLFVLTSDYEGMPNALMEAMAMGVPSVSSDCKTGPGTLIQDGENGLLFKKGDVNDFLDKLNWAMDHTEEMNQMGQNARSSILQSYKTDDICDNMRRVLDAVTAERKC